MYGTQAEKCIQSLGNEGAALGWRPCFSTLLPGASQEAVPSARPTLPHIHQPSRSSLVDSERTGEYLLRALVGRSGDADAGSCGLQWRGRSRRVHRHDLGAQKQGRCPHHPPSSSSPVLSGPVQASLMLWQHQHQSSAVTTAGSGGWWDSVCRFAEEPGEEQRKKRSCYPPTRVASGCSRSCRLRSTGHLRFARC